MAPAARAVEESLWDGASAVLTFAIGVAVSPIPIIAVILMLFSRRARVNGPVFLLGWMLALAVVGMVVYLLADQSSPTTSSSAGDSISWGKIVLGVLLLLLAVRNWRNRPARDAQPEMPKWMAGVDTLSPGKVSRPDRRQSARGQGPLRGRVPRLRRVHAAPQRQGRRVRVLQLACHPGAIAPRWTRQRVLEAMREWQARFGWLPSSYGWSGTHARRRGGEALERLAGREWPPASVVSRVFGIWVAARAVAVSEGEWRPGGRATPDRPTRSTRLVTQAICVPNRP